MKPPIDVLLRGEESGGRLALVEMDVPAGAGGPPLHVHETWDEGFYVVAGEITFQAGERRVTAHPGTFIFAPRGTPHTFANLGPTDARMLIVLTPAGFEPYLLSGERPPPTTRAVGPAIDGVDRPGDGAGHAGARPTAPTGVALAGWHGAPTPGAPLDVDTLVGYRRPCNTRRGYVQ